MNCNAELAWLPISFTFRYTKCVKGLVVTANTIKLMIVYRPILPVSRCKIILAEGHQEPSDHALLIVDIIGQLTDGGGPSYGYKLIERHWKIMRLKVNRPLNVEYHCSVSFSRC